MKYSKSIKIYRPLLLLFCLVIIGAAISEARPSMYGFEPAYPDSVPSFVPPSEFSIRVSHEKKLDFILEIDKKGTVKKISSAVHSDSLYVVYYRRYLKALTFQPALFNGKVVKSKLPVRLITRRSYRVSNLTFPVDESVGITDDLLYSYCFELNKVELPKINYFPSYFIDIDKNDSTHFYPYLLLKLSLDKKGKLTAMETVLSNMGSFEQEFKSAVLYAEFEPLKVSKKKQPTDVYLLMSAFRQLEYPTAVVDGSEESTDFHKKLSIQLLPRLGDYTALPIPDFNNPDLIPRDNLSYYSGDTASAVVTIDTLGQVSYKQLRGGMRNMADNFKHYFSNINYYPALDKSGKPVEFSGLIQFIPVDDRNIRIKHLWLLF